MYGVVCSQTNENFNQIAGPGSDLPPFRQNTVTTPSRFELLALFSNRQWVFRGPQIIVWPVLTPACIVFFFYRWISVDRGSVRTPQQCWVRCGKRPS